MHNNPLIIPPNKKKISLFKVDINYPKAFITLCEGKWDNNSEIKHLVFSINLIFDHFHNLECAPLCLNNLSNCVVHCNQRLIALYMYSIFVYPSHDDEITRGAHLTVVKVKHI